MDVKINVGPPLYCDVGPHEGQVRVDFRGVVYINGDELEQYYKNSITVVLGKDEDEPVAFAPDERRVGEGNEPS